MKIETQAVNTIKTKGGKKIWIISITIAVIVLALWIPSMANHMIAKFAPDKYLALSLLEMQKLIDKESKNHQVLLPKNRKINFNLNLKEIDGIYDTYYKEIIEGLGLSFSLANSHDQDIKIDLGLEKGGTGLIDLNIYSSNQELGIKIPGLLDQYIIVNLNQFKEQYDASELYYYMGNIEEESVDMVKDSLTQIRNTIAGELTNTYASLSEDYKQVFLDLAKDINIRYTGSTKTIIADKNKKASSFLISLDSADIKSFVRSFTRSTLRNKDVRKSLEALYGISNSYYSLEYFEEMLDETIREMKFSDIEITCLVDQKKRIVAAELTTATNIDGEKIKIDLDYALSGGSNLFHQAAVNARFQSNDERLQFSLEKDKTHDNKKSADTLTFRVRDNSDQLLRASLNIEQDLGAREDNYALTSNITTYDDMKFNFKINGDLVSNKNSGEMSLHANKIAFNVDSYGESLDILGSGYFEIQDLKNESIALSNSQKLDLFSMDIFQMYDMIERINQQFSELEYMFY